MTKRTERNTAIIRQLEIEANISAGSYLDEVEEFQRLYRLERMQDIVFDLAEWIEEVGDLKLLNDLGVTLEEVEDGLLFKQEKRSMAVSPRDDMSISVDGKIMHPDVDCPVLDRAFYDELMASVFEWAMPDVETKAERRT